MHILDIIKTANGNLLRSKTRTILTVLAVFIGSFTIILNTAINAGVNDFIDKQVETVGGNDYIEITAKAMGEQIEARMNGGNEVREYKGNTEGSENIVFMTDNDIKTIEEIPGIESVHPYHIISPEYITSDNTDKKYDVSVGYVPSKNINIDTTAGRSINSDNAENEIVITESYVDALGFDSNEDAIGKTVRIAVAETVKCYIVAIRSDCLTEVEATIVGVQAPGVIMNMGALNINLAFDNALYEVASTGMSAAQKNRVLALTAIVDPDRAQEIKETLNNLDYYAITVDDQIGMIRTFFDAILIVFTIFGGIALLAAAIGIINTLFMSVQERTREIGLSKALGMSNSKIFFSFSVEACLLGFWGSIVGIAVSMVAGYSINLLAHQTFLSDFPTFQLVMFKPLNMITITLIIMFIAFLSGTLPARKASKKNPIDALRYE